MVVRNGLQCFLSGEQFTRLLQWKLSPSQVIRFRSSVAAAPVEAEVGWDDAKPFSEIPGPKAYPVVKALPYILTKLPFKLTEFSKLTAHFRENYGHFVRFELPRAPPILYVYDPVLVETILKLGVGKWPVRFGAEYFALYRKKVRKDWYGGVAGLVPENGEEWWNIRSKVQQPMMRPNATHVYLPAMGQVSQEFIDHIRQIRDPGTKEVPEDFQNELYKWALESVGLVALNTRLGCLGTHFSEDSDGQHIINAVNIIFATMSEMEMHLLSFKYFPIKPWRVFVKQMDIISKVGMKHVSHQLEEMKKKEAGETGEQSMLERFLLTPGMNKEVAIAMALDMIFAGIDTTGNAIGFFLYHVAQNPDVQSRLQKEVDAVVPDRNKTITADDINQLQYMKAAIKESMRIHPIALGLNRIIQNDIVVSGYQIPKGTVFLACFMDMSREDCHYPQPMKFQPERWLRGDAQYNTANPYTFAPFGHGARMCVGKRIAEQELWVLATKIIQNFHIEYHYEDIGIMARMLNVPDKPLRFQFHERNP